MQFRRSQRRKHLSCSILNRILYVPRKTVFHIFAIILLYSTIYSIRCREITSTKVSLFCQQFCASRRGISYIYCFLRTFVIGNRLCCACNSLCSFILMNSRWNDVTNCTKIEMHVKFRKHSFLSLLRYMRYENLLKLRYHACNHASKAVTLFWDS